MSNLATQLAHSWPPAQWADVGVVVAVSGGADSVALLRAMAEVRNPGPGSIVVAHYNHQLRGEASDGDEEFVRRLAASLGLPIEVGRWEQRGEKTEPTNQCDDDRSDTVGEAAAREARYEFLLNVAHQQGARFVATAHTADDQAETVLHHVLRGTGLAGLAGMSRTRRLSEAVTLIRPMLTCSRADAEQYLAELGQEWRHDATNDNLNYTRNRIRHEVLPQLAASFNPRLGDALRNLAQSAAGAREVIDRLTAELVEEACESESAERVAVRLARLRDEPTYLVRETLIAVWRRQGWPRQAMRYEHWDRLAEMTRDVCDIAAQVFPGNVHARREGGRLVLARSNTG